MGFTTHGFVFSPSTFRLGLFTGKPEAAFAAVAEFSSSAAADAAAAAETALMLPKMALEIDAALTGAAGGGGAGAGADCDGLALGGFGLGGAAGFGAVFWGSGGLVVHTDGAGVPHGADLTCCTRGP
eukprot:CAMPEP_0195653504 /NCGR_PEP_ID=MMETSP0815-20121206/33428_1 /TAXON_ID=97485 /ORGANISM="Prymnesium parvum, Strain Texoma1" /LENGTH=126 /DNA_ID=CAMNT_0040797665 /DNA_START=392 /DNA_END=773 /DNA_ORIENTATION=+